MRFISYGVMAYTLMAFIWWSVLLSRYNDQIYLLSKDNIVIDKQKPTLSLTDTKPLNADVITATYKKNKAMIIGEGMMFGLALIIGIWLIQKAYNKDIESTNKQKNFLMSITHELKSPIASINLITETLIKRPLTLTQQSELHNSILSESARLETLINKLLLTTRIDHNYQYHLEPIDIDHLLVKIIANNQKNYPQASINYQGAGNPTIINADKEAVVSIFNNLIENGFKYCDTNHPMVEITLSHTENFTQIAVKDNGVGIPNLEKNKIFKQFYRVGSEDIRSSKGTGLGLYITHKIVKAHKWSIAVHNNEPKGSIFVITIPKFS